MEVEVTFENPNMDTVSNEDKFITIEDKCTPISYDDAETEPVNNVTNSKDVETGGRCMKEKSRTKGDKRTYRSENDSTANAIESENAVDCNMDEESGSDGDCVMDIDENGISEWNIKEENDVTQTANVNTDCDNSIAIRASTKIEYTETTVGINNDITKTTGVIKDELSTFNRSFENVGDITTKGTDSDVSLTKDVINDDSKTTVDRSDGYCVMDIDKNGISEWNIKEENDVTQTANVNTDCDNSIAIRASTKIEYTETTVGINNDITKTTGVIKDELSTFTRSFENVGDITTKGTDSDVSITKDVINDDSNTTVDRSDGYCVMDIDENGISEWNIKEENDDTQTANVNTDCDNSIAIRASTKIEYTETTVGINNDITKTTGVIKDELSTFTRSFENVGDKTTKGTDSDVSITKDVINDDSKTTVDSIDNDLTPIKDEENTTTKTDVVKENVTTSNNIQNDDVTTSKDDETVVYKDTDDIAVNCVAKTITTDDTHDLAVNSDAESNVTDDTNDKTINSDDITTITDDTDDEAMNPDAETTITDDLDDLATNSDPKTTTTLDIATNDIDTDDKTNSDTENDVIIEEPQIEVIDISDEDDDDDNIPLSTLLQPHKQLTRIMWGSHTDYYCMQCHFRTTDNLTYVNHKRADKYCGGFKKKCLQCEFKTDSKAQFERHRLTHLEDKSYRCHLCDYKAKYEKTLLQHLETHGATQTTVRSHRPRINKLQCEKCFLILPNQQEKVVHSLQCEKVHIYKCNVKKCKRGERFQTTSKVELQWHILEHHKAKKMMRVCEDNS